MSILQARHCPHCKGTTYHRLKSRYRCRFTPGDMWECVSCATSRKRVRPSESEAVQPKTILRARS